MGVDLERLEMRIWPLSLPDLPGAGRWADGLPAVLFCTADGQAGLGCGGLSGSADRLCATAGGGHRRPQQRLNGGRIVRAYIPVQDFVDGLAALQIAEAVFGKSVQEGASPSGRSADQGRCGRPRAAAGQ
jgi:hypothetical protein